jgi:hypothetical protein
MKTPKLLIVLTAILSAVCCSARTWTDHRGKTVEAELVGESYGTLTLKTDEGKILKIAVAKLSKADQDFVKAQSREKPSATPGLSFKSETAGGKSAAVVAGDPEVVKLMAPGTIFKRTARGDTGISYHVYTPPGFDAQNPPPLIIAFSPGGSGMQMVNAMKASAEKAGWVLIGCNDLKNKMDDNGVERKMEDEVLDDIFAVVPNNPGRIYLAGLSGGALRAYNLCARRDERTTGIIAYGGWLGGDEYATKLDYCKYMAVAIVNGDKDKAANSWIAKDTGRLEKSRCTVKHYSFPGGHEIAPAAVMDDVIAWLNKEWEKSGCKRTRWR